MNMPLKKLALVTLCAALLGTGAVANARSNNTHRGPAATQHNQYRPGTRPSTRPARPRPQSRPKKRPRPAYRPAYRRGGHMPSAWRRSPSRRISNWRSDRRLYAPPRGHYWVRGDNGDILLVAIATGVIASIITGAMAY